MRKGLILIGGVGLGAGLMFAFDPEKGRRRRALLRDKRTRILGETRAVVDRSARAVRNRIRGLIAETAAAFRCETVSDAVLEERVRSKMGRVVSEPGQIEVLATDGQVTLRGVVPAVEADKLLSRVSRVRGVRGVESQLNVRGRHEIRHEPSRAGENGIAPHVSGEMSKAMRLFITITGSGLALYGARKRNVVGSTIGFIGMRMLTRGLGDAALGQHRSAIGNGKSA